MLPERNMAWMCSRSRYPETSCGTRSRPDARVGTTVRKRGRRVSLIDIELTQCDRTAVYAAVTLGDPEHGHSVGEAGYGTRSGR
jgi:hypothetical protein